MNKKNIVLFSTILLGSLLAISPAAHAAENNDGGEYLSNGVINYIPNTDPTDPVNPLDPENQVTPIDPTNPDGVPTPGTNGPLSIDFASSLVFGEQKITSKTETYYAESQKYTNSADEENEGPNFVQVSDNRGTETGWILKVKQNGQFKTASKKNLTGAQITMSNGNIVSASDSAKPTGVTSFSLNPDGTESLVMSAESGQGAGTYLMDWGNSVESAKKSISLEVPGSTTKYADSYTTTFTWVLTDAPENAEISED